MLRPDLPSSIPVSVSAPTPVISPLSVSIPAARSFTTSGFFLFFNSFLSHYEGETLEKKKY